MSDAIISVEGLGKRYRLGASNSSERYTALRDVIAQKAAAPFRFLRGVGRSKIEDGNGKGAKTEDGSQSPNSKLLALQKKSFGH